MERPIEAKDLAAQSFPFRPFSIHFGRRIVESESMPSRLLHHHRSVLKKTKKILNTIKKRICVFERITTCGGNVTPGLSTFLRANRPRCSVRFLSSVGV